MRRPATLMVVQDLALSIPFYTQVLGFTLVQENDQGTKLNLGGHDVFMFQGSMASVDYEHGYNANSTLIIPVENLDDSIEKLKAKGIEFVHDTPSENKWGRYAGFKDPNGIVHELMEFYT